MFYAYDSYLHEYFINTFFTAITELIGSCWLDLLQNSDYVSKAARYLMPVVGNHYFWFLSAFKSNQMTVTM